jgi:3-hydroxyacyl-CoA dehydrogenase / enoyl-CoA hydratase / 3-hydroxybutyryl-CoA epimerase
VNTTPTEITWQQDGDGVVILTMDARDKGANTMSASFLVSFRETVERLAAESDRISGVVLTSAKRSFFAGGDLHEMLAYRREDASAIMADLTAMKRLLRTLETLSVPVVAAINGAALGGGLEIALATHHRVAVDAAGTRLGLPEVTLGLLPGGGGIVRTVRMLGARTALDEVLLSGAELSARRALELGLVDELVAERDALVPAAKAWIAANPEPAQPWDRPDHRIPGGAAAAAALGAPTFAALTKSLKGAPYPAPFAVLSAAVEGAQLDLETALVVESQYFIELATGPVAKNMIRGGFLDMQRVRTGASRPSDVPPSEVRRLAVVGAGMMGAGIAYMAARNGIEVVLRDVSIEAAERGRSYSVTLGEKAVARGSQTPEQAQAIVDRITPTADMADIAGVDAVIEAVFEDPDVKKGVFREIVAHAPDALLASNTSTLPIGDLAGAVSDPSRFIGMHFFSPVDKMPLLEIVVGARTSDETLARAFDLGQRLQKTPIVVNDARGFFTSRVITQYVDESLALVGEGVPAPMIEHAATQIGYPTGPLQLIDETTLTLPHGVRQENRAAALAAGEPWIEHPGERVMTAMVEEFGRPGRSGGAGFFDYVGGRRTGVWPGLAEHYGVHDDIPLADVQDRLTFIEALETVKCLDAGVLRSAAEGNVGSVLGIGFPRWTGGAVQFINGYPGGVPAFVARADQLADRYGERFRPTASLVALAGRGPDARIE